MDDFDVADLRERLAKIEKKVLAVGDLIALTIALGLGICVGEAVAEYPTQSHTWGWSAALACGATVGVAYWLLGRRLGA